MNSYVKIQNDWSQKYIINLIVMKSAFHFIILILVLLNDVVQCLGVWKKLQFVNKCQYCITAADTTHNSISRLLIGHLIREAFKNKNDKTYGLWEFFLFNLLSLLLHSENFSVLTFSLSNCISISSAPDSLHHSRLSQHLEHPGHGQHSDTESATLRAEMKDRNSILTLWMYFTT